MPYFEMKEAKGLRKITGLMFRDNDTEPLVFKFDENVWHSIHSLFVFFDFIIIWFNERDEVIAWDIVEPFSYSVNSPKPYRKFIEIPIHKKNEELIKKILGKVPVERYLKIK